MGIGTTTPEGALDVVSTDSGVILPRVANAAAVTTPVNGMLIYDLSTKCVRVYQNSDWSLCFGDPVPSVGSPTGKIWMDRNLGATQVATSSTDADSYGDLYQWGRNTHGHQLRTSSVTVGPVSSGSEGSDFIRNGTTPYNWLSTQDDTRWGATKTANDPCPSGYRVPTEAELESERTLFSSNDANGAYASVLKLPAAGNRNASTAAFNNVDINGYYWSSTVNGSNARNLAFYISTANMYDNARSFGFSVRCIR